MKHNVSKRNNEPPQQQQQQLLLQQQRRQQRSKAHQSSEDKVVLRIRMPQQHCRCHLHRCHKPSDNARRGCSRPYPVSEPTSSVSRPIRRSVRRREEKQIPPQEEEEWQSFLTKGNHNRAKSLLMQCHIDAFANKFCFRCFSR